MVGWLCWQEDDEAKEVNEELPPPSTAVSIFPRQLFLLGELRRIFLKSSMAACWSWVAGERCGEGQRRDGDATTGFCRGHCFFL